MTLFQSIDSFFKSLFSNSAKDAQAVIHAAGAFSMLAMPVVTSLAAVTNTNMSKDVLVGGVKAFLLAHEPDVPKVEAFLGTTQGMTAAALLHEAAVWVLSMYLPANTSRSLLDLAIQLAYSIFMASQAAQKPAHA